MAMITGRLTKGIDNASFPTDDNEFEQKLREDAEVFEQKLKDEVIDPLQRALKRKQFYSEQDEIRQERKRTLGTIAKRKERGVHGTTIERLQKKCSAKFIHSRDFDANACVGPNGHTQEKSYNGPLLMYSNAKDNESKNDDTNGERKKTDVEDDDLYINQMRLQEMMLNKEDEEEKDTSDVVYENIFNEQRRLVEILEQMENDDQAKPKGIASKPVFLGEDGTLYNMFYEPLPKQDNIRGRGKFSEVVFGMQNSAEQEFNEKLKEDYYHDEVMRNVAHKRSKMLDRYEYQHDPEVYQSQPVPESFSTFDEYEEALLKWSRQVERKLGYLQLPRVTGRHYFRPQQQSSSVMENESKKNRVSTNINPRISNTLASLATSSNSSSKPFEESNDESVEEVVNETWEANLIPLEPKAEFYDTFQEYEEAMIRWTILCLGLPFLPPHAAQYQSLLGLKLVNDPPFQIAGVVRSSDLDLEGEKNEKRDLSNDDESERGDRSANYLNYEIKEEWNNLTPEVKQRIEKSINEVMKKKKETKTKYGTYHQSCLPCIHGTFRTESTGVELKLKIGERVLPENIRSWIVFQRQEKSLSCVPADCTIAYISANTSREYTHQIPLRRTDLKEQEIKMIMDCDEMEQGRPVIFETPEFDLGQAEHGMLNNPNYIRFLQIVLARKDNEKRYNHLNSWYFPKEESKLLDESYSKLCAILDAVEHPSQILVNHFERVFLSPAYLDIFCQFLGSELKMRMTMMKNGVELRLRTYADLLYHSTSKQHFSAILKIFQQSDSTLVHAKVAQYVKEYLKTDIAKDVIAEYIQDDDYESMHFVARAVTLFDEVPFQLFEYTESTRSVVNNIVLTENNPNNKNDLILKKVDKFLVTLMMLYYTNCVCVSLVEEDTGYPHLYPFLIDKVEKYIDEVNKYLKCSRSFLKNHIWKLLGSRSKTVTALGKFVLSFLFFLSWKEDIHNVLKSDETDLLPNIRKLACSKFSHVQHATARLFPILKEKKWEELLTKAYSNGQTVVKDLVRSAERSVLDSQPPLISSMVLEFLTETLTVKQEEFSEMDESYSMIVGLIESKAFQIVLDEVISTENQKRMHQGTIMGALFLAKYSKFLICNQLVQAGGVTKKETDAKKKQTTGGFWDRLKDKTTRKKKNEGDETKIPLYAGPKVEITQANLQSMWDFICKNVKLRRAYRPRSALLVAFSQLIKVPEIFALLSADQTFYAKLLELCKDDVDMEFNRNAWRLFYQLIKFHGQGPMDDIIKFNLMTGFLSLINKENSSIIATNALHYFNKIFNLPIDKEILNKLQSDEEETEETNETYMKGYNIPPNNNEKYTNAVKSLIDFILKQKLVEALFQSAYETWSKDYKGWPFQTLASLFYTINTHSSCQRLSQQFKKKDTSKEALQKVEDMVNAPNVKADWWDFKRKLHLTKDVMDWNMKHKHYQYTKF
ncbi:hypothetical protein ABK040_016772 [Willaertia magna]